MNGLELFNFFFFFVAGFMADQEKLYKSGTVVMNESINLFQTLKFKEIAECSSGNICCDFKQEEPGFSVIIYQVSNRQQCNINRDKIL